MIDDGLKSKIGDYCYRTFRPYPTNEKMIEEILEAMMIVGFVTREECSSFYNCRNDASS